MLSRRVPLAAVLAGLGVVAIAAAVASPALEVRSALREGVALEVSLVQAPMFWRGMLIAGTGLPTLMALVLATIGVAHVGTPASRLAFVGAAGGVQLDIGLLRLAAWDVLGTGAGVAGTRFGLVMLGAAVGLLLLAAAAVKTAAHATSGPGRSWTVGDLLPSGTGRGRFATTGWGSESRWQRVKRRVRVSRRSNWL